MFSLKDLRRILGKNLGRYDLIYSLRGRGLLHRTVHGKYRLPKAPTMAKKKNIGTSGYRSYPMVTLNLMINNPIWKKVKFILNNSEALTTHGVASLSDITDARASYYLNALWRSGLITKTPDGLWVSKD